MIYGGEFRGEVPLPPTVKQLHMEVRILERSILKTSGEDFRSTKLGDISKKWTSGSGREPIGKMSRKGE